MSDPRGKALVTLLCCATLTAMAGATIAPALPDLQAHFDRVPGASSWVPLVLTIPGLAIAVGSPIAGWIVDRSVKRHVLLFGVTLYIVAGSSGLYLDTIGHIIAGRVFLGIGVACLMTATMALIAGLYEGEERARVMGLQAASISLGSVIFIMAGGLLADISWRAPFGAYLVPIALLPFIVLHVPHGRPTAVTQTQAESAAAVFPLRRAMAVYIAVFGNFLVFYTVPLKIPFALREMGVESAALAGGAIATLTLASGIVSLQFGRLQPLASPPAIMAASFLVVAAGFGALAFLPPVPAIFALMVVIGMASGVVLPNSTTWLYSFVPAQMQGRAAGLATMSVFTAQFLSAPMVTFLENLGGLALIYAGAAIIALIVALYYCVLALRMGAASAKTGP